jgi:riboflavin kinase / FMN adenylyltransferase
MNCEAMDVVRGIASLAAPLRDSVCAIGNFDGVHLGHQALCRAARDGRGSPVVLTFDPPPSAVLHPGGAPPRLTTLERKAELLAAQGIETLVVEPFTQALAALTPDEFAEEVLAGKLGVKEIVVGWNFRYGKKRAGDVSSLRRSGERLGFGVRVVDAVTVDGQAASSTAVRELVKQGDVAAAARLLGRLHDADGVVVHGAKRGRELGIPTANVSAPATLLPALGIYATTLSAGGPPLPAVASLGTNPTFGAGHPLSLEVHVLDWDGDLYGRTVRVGFHSFLRGEQRFDSVEALLAAMRRDCDEARARLKGHP